MAALPADAKVVFLRDEEVARAARSKDGVSAIARTIPAGTRVVVIGADRFVGPSPEGRIDPTVAAVPIGLARPDVTVLVAVVPGREHPFNVARRVLSIHHVLGGRAGILLGTVDGSAPVGSTSWTDAAGSPDGFAEFVAVVRALWASWPIASIVGDRDRGIYADTSEIHPIDHAGVWNVAGPLPTPSYDGAPPIVATWRAHLSVAADVVLDESGVVA